MIIYIYIVFGIFGSRSHDRLIETSNVLNNKISFVIFINVLTLNYWSSYIMFCDYHNIFTAVIKMYNMLRLANFATIRSSVFKSFSRSLKYDIHSCLISYYNIYLDSSSIIIMVTSIFIRINIYPSREFITTQLI